VTLTPGDASEKWHVAARALEKRLDRADADCRTVQIQVAGAQAFLFFTTGDGRQTVRQVESPGEVAPLVEALLVTVPLPSPREKPSAAPLQASGPALPQPPAKERMASPAPTGARIVLRASAGGRVAGPGAFLAPSFEGGIGVLVGHWELAAVGEWAPAHTALDGSAPKGFSMSRYAVGVTAGGRAPLGPVAIVFGASTMVAVITQSVGDEQGPGNAASGASAAEPLVGLYAGLAYPPTSPLRGRVAVGADVVVSRIGQQTSIDPALPALPWWSASAAVGVEWEAP
jgi:hypothetical protein